MNQISDKQNTLDMEGLYTEYLTPPKRLSAADWLGSLMGIPKSRILRRIRHPLISMTLVAFAITVLHCVCGMPGLASLAGHNLIGFLLSLLLVFRTNSAYQRFQEGRKIWNDILDISRDIALSMALYRENAGPVRMRIIRTTLQAFPFSMQEHVRAKTANTLHERLQNMLLELDDMNEFPGTTLDHVDFADDYAKEAVTDEIVKNVVTDRRSLEPSRNNPLHIISRLLKVINSIPNDEQGYFTNRERVWLLSLVCKLSHTVGRCERLVQTPVPLSYGRHTSRFVAIWTLTLPLALVGTMRWLTAPVVFFITWALFGVLEIGHMIEDPFRRTIELTPICEALYNDIARILYEMPALPSPVSTPQLASAPTKVVKPLYSSADGALDNVQL